MATVQFVADEIYGKVMGESDIDERFANKSELAF